MRPVATRTSYSHPTTSCANQTWRRIQIVQNPPKQEKKTSGTSNRPPATPRPTTPSQWQVGQSQTRPHKSSTTMMASYRRRPRAADQSPPSPAGSSSSRAAAERISDTPETPRRRDAAPTNTPPPPGSRCDRPESRDLLHLASAAVIFFASDRESAKPNPPRAC